MSAVTTRPVVHVVPARPDVHAIIPTWRAVCATRGCGWRSEAHQVKAGAQEAARWHRDSHRVAAS